MKDRHQRPRTTRTAPHSSRGRGNRLHLEPLEDRRLLAAVTYVNDNWVNLDGPTLEEGDQVRSTLDSGDLVNAEYGFNAFGTVAGLSLAQFATIHSAIQHTDIADPPGTVWLLPGTYRESDIVIDRPVNLVGRMVSGARTAVIVPEVTSSQSTAANFATGTRSGIIIYAPNVTIKDLEIDGNGNGSLSGSLNYHHGITTLYDLQNGANYSSLRNGPLLPLNVAADSGVSLLVDNVGVRNTWYSGITVSGTTGKSIPNARVNNVSVESIGASGQQDTKRVGVLLQNIDDGEVINSDVDNAGVGIATRTFGTASPSAARNRTGVRLHSFPSLTTAA